MGPDDSQRARGRPSGARRTEIARDLLDAAERSLAEKTYSEISLREIAEAAGSSQAMVGYYFQSKDGLFAALIKSVAEDLAVQLTELEQNIRNLEDNPTRRFIAILVNSVQAHPGISRIVVSEAMRKQSPIKDFYIKRYVLQSRTGLDRIERFLSAMVAAGLYDAGIDLAYGSLAVFTLALTPVLTAAHFPAPGSEIDELNTESWIDYLTELFDRRFRPERR